MGSQLSHLGKGFFAVSHLPGYLENKKVVGASSLSPSSGSTGSSQVQRCPEKAQRGPHTAAFRLVQPLPEEALCGFSSSSVPESTQPHVFASVLMVVSAGRTWTPLQDSQICLCQHQALSPHQPHLMEHLPGGFSSAPC